MFTNRRGITNDGLEPSRLSQVVVVIRLWLSSGYGCQQSMKSSRGCWNWSETSWVVDNTCSTAIVNPDNFRHTTAG